MFDKIARFFRKDAYELALKCQTKKREEGLKKIFDNIKRRCLEGEFTLTATCSPYGDYDLYKSLKDSAISSYLKELGYDVETSSGLYDRVVVRWDSDTPPLCKCKCHD